MQRDLLEAVSAKAKYLDRGGYARVHRKNGKAYPSHLHLAVGELLRGLGVSFREGVPVRGSKLIADFQVGQTLLMVDRQLTEEDRDALARSGRDVVMVSRSANRMDLLDDGLRVVGMGDQLGRLQTIFLDDPSFNFDYAHILPKTEKCSVMHGHTSSALVEIVGVPRDGMVVDFNDAKPIVRQAVASLDHKLFINSKYVVARKGGQVRLRFETVHGPFSMEVPAKTTVLMDGEATVENLAKELLDRIAPKMPPNVEAVGVYVYEGLNKGTHLLARIHEREAERRRKR